MYYLPEYSTLGILDKRADVLYLFRVGELFAGHSHTVLQHPLRVDDAIGFMDSLDSLTGESPAAQTYEVHTSIANGFFACNDVGRNVLTGTSTALEHNISPDVEELVEQTCCRNDGTVVDYHFSCKLRRVADDASVADDAVVSDVHILHQQVAVTYYRLTLRSSTATDGDVLANRIVIANFASGFLALELQILRLCRNRSTWENLVVVAQTGSKVERHAIQQLIVVANNHVFVNHTERADDIVVTQLGFWVNDS